MIKYCFKRMATVFALVVIFMVQLTAQRGMVWSTDKDVYYTYEEGGIFRYELPSQNKVEVVNANDIVRKQMA